MTNLGNVLERSILEWYLTTNATSTANTYITARPTSWYVSLHYDSGSLETDAAWTATEVQSSGAAASSGGLNYARAAIGWSTASAGETNAMVNSNTVTFVSAGSSGGGWAVGAASIKYIGVWNSSGANAGSLLFWVNTNDINVNSTDVVTINSGAITLTMD